MSPTRPPANRIHKPSGQAVTTVRTPDGKRKDVYLSPWKSKESNAAYQRVLAEMARVPVALLVALAPGERVSVNEVLVAFLHHAQVHYRHADGTPTSEYENYVFTIRPLRKLYGFRREFQAIPDLSPDPI
jgi:hypothetical protein